MKIISFLILCSLCTVSCTDPGITTSAPSGLSGNGVEVGSYSNQELESLHAVLAKLDFPLEEGTVARLLPHPIRGLLETSIEGMPNPSGSGRISGKIVEYWLNEDHLLKVATAYFPLEERHVGREEWAIILPKAQRNYSRPFYATLKESPQPINRAIQQVAPVTEQTPGQH